MNTFDHFQLETSHYSRNKNPNRTYLSPLLSINTMYDQYLEWSAAKEVKQVSSIMYRSIFCTDFNLGFGSPRSDTCSRCDTLSGQQLTDHQEMAENAFKQQGLDKNICTK